MFVENKRHTTRLQGYDYRHGLFFVTIGTYKHVHVLGKIVNGDFIENELGDIVKKWYFELKNKYRNIELGLIQLMPNHVHAIVRLKNGIVEHPKERLNKMIGRGNRAPTLGRVVAFWKYNATKEINCRGGVAPPLYERNWNHLFEGNFFQRNYFEHIIKDNKELIKVEKYMKLNPRNWEFDKERNIRNFRNV